MMHDFWATIFDKGAWATAGAAGGLSRWLTLREGWRNGSISLIVGVLTATFIGPIAAPVITGGMGALFSFLPGDIEFPADNANMAAGYIVGAGGIGVVGFVLDFVKKLREKAS